MSLMQRLWLALLLTTMVSFFGSLAVTLLTARSYLQQQLFVQSNDSANSLALSMTQQPKDRVTLETMINALFDHGHYQLVRFTSTDGQTVVERLSSESAPQVPDWFKQLLPLHEAPAQADVSNGWQQFGSITVVAHNRYAYESLWRGAGMLLVLMAGIGILGGWLASLIIRSIRHPLRNLVAQAEAVAQRQFIRVDEPRIPELKRVVRAMNTMVARVKTLFDEETARMARLRQEANSDPLTGLANRPFFLARLHTSLHEEDSASYGVLLSFRLNDLVMWNHSLGREQTDELVCLLAHRVNQAAQDIPDAVAGRLGGGELALLIPNGDPAMANSLLRSLQQQWREILHARQLNDHGIHASGVSFQRGKEAAQLLALVEKYYLPLAQFSLHVSEDGGGLDWAVVLSEALSEHQFYLLPFPVLDRNGRLIHQELVLRLQLSPHTEPLSAMNFLHHAQRLNCLAAIDREVLSLGLAWVKKHGEPAALNLSSALLHDNDLCEKLRAQLFAHPAQSEKLWLEVSESGMAGWNGDVVQRLAAFAHSVRALNVRTGLEHFGRRFEHLPRLHDTGLDYLKIDASFVHDIPAQGTNQAVVKSILAIAHGLDMQVMAVGVNHASEHETLLQLGIDGVTGPAIRAPQH